MTDNDVSEEQSYPVVQDSSIADEHVELDYPAQKKLILMDDETAQAVAEDIMRIIEGRDDD